MLAYTMIVRDCEHTLHHTLRSIKAAETEVYINDTGSTDSTVRLAKKYSTHVTESTWNNSFAEARNRDLAAINDRQDVSHWMWVDSDDELVYETDSSLALEEGTSYMIRLVDAYTKEECWQLRIIANTPEAHWVNRVHEEVENVTAIKKCYDIKCVHYGYASDKIRKAKHTRNYKLLLLDETDRDSEDHYWFIRGLAAREIGVSDWKECFEKCITLSSDCVTKARCYYEMGEYKKSIMMCPSSDALVSLAESCEDIGERKMLCMQALDLLSQDTVFPRNDSMLKRRVFLLCN